MNRRVALAWLLVMSAALSAMAEVTVQRDGSRARLQVTSTPRGVWAPSGQIDARVLNPTGDLFGDGIPGHATCDDGVVAAWVRPTEAQVRVASADDAGWVATAAIDARGAVGTPLVACQADGALVAWRFVVDGQQGVGLTALGEPDSIEHYNATLLDLGSSGSTSALLVAEPDGLSGTRIVLAIPSPPGVPIDLTRIEVAQLDEDAAQLLRLARLHGSESLGLAPGRVLVTLPTNVSGQLAVLVLEGDAHLTELAVIDIPNGQGEGSLRAALRKAMRDQ